MGCNDRGCLDRPIGHQGLQTSQGIEQTVTVVINGRVDSEALACRQAHTVVEILISVQQRAEAGVVDAAVIQL